MLSSHQLFLTADGRYLRLLHPELQVYETGDVDAGIWSAGIAVGLIKDIPTCEELLRRIEREAEETIDGLAQMKTSGVKAKL